MKADIHLDRKKIELIQWLSSVDNIKIIDKLLAFKNREADLWDMLSEEEKTSIEKGLADAEAGRLKPHTEAKKRYEKWL